ncbi:hypothetical protein BT96DRAFT_710479 [Gymnopus androsaceus JB14]|uniref:Uncharacterized protein n=1 Tax=Gymnopus androsaceus JB14 TaxID=1447944 RepID=A0A6A4HKM2_9AGAR|nr:hypothetical protein BT96DRAFT_710479 [Gymnopus androsaceus JB14]
MYLKGDEADQHIKEDFTNSRRLTPQMESTGDPEISLIAKRPPRREIIWNAFGFSKSSLSDISQTYENVIFNDSIQLPRRLGRSVIGYRRACSCEGYSREEITFTPDAFRNAVLIYQQPSPNERCGLCGELLPTPTIIIPQPSNHTRDEDDYGRDVQMKKPAASSRDSTLPVSTGISNHRPMSPEALADLAEKELENRKMIAEHEQEHVTSRKGSFSVRDQLSSLFQSGRGSSSRNSSWGFLGRSRSRRYIDARTGSEVDRHGRPVYRV